MKQYYFIAGLPRSGANLLTVILNQNPQFHASAPDNLLEHFKTQISCAKESHNTAYNKDQLKAMLLGTVDGFYYNVASPTIFNTNYLWTSLLPEIKTLYPYTKVICCVRDITKIIDSFERLYQNNPFLTTSPHTIINTSNTYTRTEALMEKLGAIRLPYDSLKSAITGSYSNDLLLIEYDLLTKNPQGIMKAIYNFINQPYFEHDFNNIETSSGSNKYLHLHKKQIQQNNKGYIIPPDIVNQYSGLEVWRY